MERSPAVRPESIALPGLARRALLRERMFYSQKRLVPVRRFPVGDRHRLRRGTLAIVCGRPSPEREAVFRPGVGSHKLGVFAPTGGDLLRLHGSIPR